MVAVAIVISVANVIAAGLNSAAFRVWFQEEVGIVDSAVFDVDCHRLVHQHMVDAFPAAFVAIGAFSTMGLLMNILHNSMSYLGKNVISM